MTVRTQYGSQRRRAYLDTSGPIRPTIGRYYDGMGPAGQGSMTGRGRGICAGEYSPIAALLLIPGIFLVVKVLKQKH